MMQSAPTPITAPTRAGPRKRAPNAGAPGYATTSRPRGLGAPRRGDAAIASSIGAARSRGRNVVELTWGRTHWPHHPPDEPR